MKLKRVTAALAAGSCSVVLLAGCAPASGGARADVSCSVPVVNEDAPQVVVWGWWNALGDVVQHFNETHDDVQVCFTNVGQSADEYPKLRTALTAGTGAPDVVMIEYDQLASFAIDGSVIDLSEHGIGDVESEYTAGAWNNVSIGDGVYGVPVDGGPVGLYYRADLFEAAGIAAPPTTWAEYAKQAAQFAASGAEGHYGNFSLNTTPLSIALFEQAGAEPFEFDLANPDQIGIDLDDEKAVEVLDYWQTLVDEGSVAKVDAFSTDNSTMLASGLQATYVGASWGTGVLQGLTASDEGAQWRVAPLPQWDAADPREAQWGGSALAVTKQAPDADLAAKVAMELYASPEAQQIEIAAGDLFPTRVDTLESAEFTEQPWDFFGGQPIMSDVFAPAAQASDGQTFSPFSGFLYAEVQKQLVAGFADGVPADELLAGIQKSVSEYATQQGLTVEAE